MLSTENPPPDPPCPCEIPQLKSSDDLRASDTQQEVDLFKSGLDDNNPVLLPKFSIRDYVFSTRSKDIKTNWPFTEKSLQTCLNHGVRDLLPPFQTLDSVKNRTTLKRCAAENSLIDHQTISNSDEEPSRPSNQADTITISSDNAECSKKLDTDCVYINSSVSEGEKEFPSSNTNPPVKKCRLIVKLGAHSDPNPPPSSKEDNTSNCVMGGGGGSDTMASKVCPVCKTFSSSSNTTLNAHIDQCLSVESPIKWTPNSKVMKHKIKPRKTKLMVDIYETAPRGTLEELDRRNGTSWAINSVLPIQQEDVACATEKKKKVLSDNFEETGDEDEVYIDANGTKVRILSKFSDSSVSKGGSDYGPPKTLKGYKRSKFHSAHKKKSHGQKNQRYLKLAPKSKKSCSLTPNRGSEIYGGLERHSAMQESSKREEHLRQRFKAQQKIKLSDSGNMRKWVSSKRTGLLKKTKCKRSLQRLGHSLRQDLLVESDRASLGDSHVERSFVLRTPNPSERPPTSPENSNKNMDISSYEVEDTECDDRSPLRKRSGFSSFGCHISGNTEQLRKEITSVHDSCKDLQKENPSSRDVSSESSWRSPTFSSKAARFSSLRSSLRKKMTGSNCNFIRKHLAPSEVSEQHDQSLQNHGENQSRVKEVNDKESLGRHGVLKIRKKRGVVSNFHREESSALKSSYLALQHYGLDVDENFDNSVGVSGNLADTFPDEEMGIEPSSRLAVPSYTRPNSMGSDEAFNGTFYGSTEAGLGDAQQMFCGDEVENDVIGRHSHFGAELDSKVGQENYFSGVDPIPIPGPPGSFLPSPGGMSSEELQENSSLTTSRLQSSEDHHDLVDRESSDSPISATSTISNSAMVRSDSRSSDWLSVGPHVANDQVRSGAVENNATVPNEAMSIRAQKTNLFADKGPHNFKNDQPCCCSRKEGTSRGLKLDYQESQLLRRRAMSSLPFPGVGEQMSDDPKKRAFNVNSNSEAFSINNCTVKVSADSALPSRGGDCESASPSASNPVLRLMGKNLMVVKKDEDFSPRNREAHSGVLHDNQKPLYRTFSGISNSSIQNGESNAFNQSVHQNPLIFGQNQDYTMGQGFEVRLSKGFSSHVINPRTPQTPSHALEAMFSRQNIGGGFVASSETRQYKGGFKLETPWAYNMEKIVATHDHHQHNADSNGNPMKGIIVIDDTPEIEANSIPLGTNYNPRQANSFYGGGSPLARNAGFEIQNTPRRANASPAKWNYTSDSSRIPHPSSLMASSSSTGHPRSSMYYPPSLS